jgi:plasmid stabilization system protein ParE
VVSKLVWARRAMEDLRSLHDFIARDSPQYAEAQVRVIQAATLHLRAIRGSAGFCPSFPPRSGGKPSVANTGSSTDTMPGSRRSESWRSCIKARCCGFS